MLFYSEQLVTYQKDFQLQEWKETVKLKQVSFFFVLFLFCFFMRTNTLSSWESTTTFMMIIRFVHSVVSRLCVQETWLNTSIIARTVVVISKFKPNQHRIVLEHRTVLIFSSTSESYLTISQSFYLILSLFYIVFVIAFPSKKIIWKGNWHIFAPFAKIRRGAHSCSPPLQ